MLQSHVCGHLASSVRTVPLPHQHLLTSCLCHVLIILTTVQLSISKKITVLWRLKWWLAFFFFSNKGFLNYAHGLFDSGHTLIGQLIDCSLEKSLWLTSLWCSLYCTCSTVKTLELTWQCLWGLPVWWVLQKKKQVSDLCISAHSPVGFFLGCAWNHLLW